MDNKLAKNAFIVALICAFLTLCQLAVSIAQWLGWKPQVGWLRAPIFQVNMLQVILTAICLAAVALHAYAGDGVFDVSNGANKHVQRFFGAERQHVW